MDGGKVALGLSIIMFFLLLQLNECHARHHEHIYHTVTPLPRRDPFHTDDYKTPDEVIDYRWEGLVRKYFHKDWPTDVY